MARARTMRYDKTGTGWGRGDALWACDAKRGNCTDFHSPFIGMRRADGIPARFDIGFTQPPHWQAQATSHAGCHSARKQVSSELGPAVANPPRF